MTAESLYEIVRVVNQKDHRGRTPLHSAKNADIVQALIAAGADINVKDGQGGTPLHYAIHADIVQVLIAAGADINVKNEEGFAPLHFAVRNLFHMIDVVKALIAAGVDVNVMTNYGITPLHLACAFANNNGDIDIVKALIAAGADINVKDRRGRTPLNMTTDAETIRVLIEAGATGASGSRLNIPITERDFNLTHTADPVSLNTINEGDEYYMMNSNVNPYSRGTLERLLQHNNPISPITRQPIVDIRRHTRANANATSGGRKRTRKQRKSNRKTKRR